VRLVYYTAVEKEKRFFQAVTSAGGAGGEKRAYEGRNRGKDGRTRLKEAKKR